MANGDTPKTLEETGFEELSVAKIEETLKLRNAAEEELGAALEKKGGLFAWIFKPVMEFFKAQASSIWTNFTTMFVTTFPGVALMLDSWRVFATKEHFNAFLDGFVENGWLDETDANGLLALHAKAGPFGRMAQVMITVMLTGKIVGAFGDVIGATAQQKMNKTYTPAVPGPGDVLGVSFIAPELHEQVVEVLKRNGYSEDDIKLMFVSRYALHPPGDVAEMFLRGILNKEQAENRLRELGYTDERIGELEQSWKRIPTLPDVVRYLAKEAFEPDMQALFGLNDGFPEESIEWAAKQGLDEKWARAEWVSHWRDLGLAPILDAFHRGFIDWKYVERYMNLIEIPPGLREIVAKSAYSVYTRVDVRRMYQLGVMNEEQVYRAYLDLGYDPEKAQNLTKFTVIDVASEDQPITRKDVIDGFKAGDVTAAEAEKLLVQVGFKEDRAVYLVYRAQMDLDRAARTQQQGLIHDKFTGNLIDEAQARAALMAAKTPIAKANELLDQWRVQVFKDQKLPSKTDLDKMFKAKIIDERTYRVELSRLGYAVKYIDWYIDMAKQGIESAA